MAKTRRDTPRQTAHRRVAHAQAIRRAGRDDPSKPHPREARRDALQAQKEPGETEDMEMATDDLHQPFAEDQEMCEEPNQCMDEETEDPFGDLQHNLDKDLTTTSSATEHSEPN